MLLEKGHAARLHSHHRRTMNPHMLTSISTFGKRSKTFVPVLTLLAPVSLVVPVLLASITAQASVTNVAWYRLGENDPGAASGVIVTNTANLLGSNPLKPIGTPRYTNAVSPGLGSSLAI